MHPGPHAQSAPQVQSGLPQLDSLAQAQSAPHAQSAPQLQSELPQPASLPQVQSGPQVHGEHVQFGLLQSAEVPVIAVIVTVGWATVI